MTTQPVPESIASPPIPDQVSHTDQSEAQVSPARLRQVVHPVDDVPAAVSFYTAVLGVPTRFVDGNRYAALDAGPVTLALAADTEDIAGIAAAAFKVDDIDSFVDRLIAAGGHVIQLPTDGPHERRVVGSDPWGNRVIAYAAL
ncbi:VOC family protein [Rhodococcus jostii]|uniref:VOC family protein n=1 Tax=Rhodococcus jostii TaxID=132919 RepID=A0ABU4CLS6_RHOJO|nr:VOC family protein [Rhodococcus jostii]MDV6284518.1 VOC family protein [Rhodococcus jostii]